MKRHQMPRVEQPQNSAKLPWEIAEENRRGLTIVDPTLTNTGRSTPGSGSKAQEDATELPWVGVFDGDMALPRPSQSIGRLGMVPKHGPFSSSTRYRSAIAPE